MAFIAIEEGNGEAAGAVRLHADPGHVEAEYAILLRSDLKGIGLGRALMKLIIDWGDRARPRGHLRQTRRAQYINSDSHPAQIPSQIAARTFDPDG